MSEITSLTFDEKYDHVLRIAKESDFIAMDCEFTGLGTVLEDISYFDEPDERYANVRESIADMQLTQLGLSMFQYDKHQVYRVSTFVFYLFPRSYPYSPEYFTCSSRSLQFLADQNFDFNKTIKYGLTYVNLCDETKIRREIYNGTMLIRMKNSLSAEQHNSIQRICKTVYEWLYESRATGHKILDLAEFDPILRYMIRIFIEQEFKVRTTYVKNFELKIEKGSRPESEKTEELIEVFLGATRLIKEILDLKKPIVGHNMLLDLMMFFKSFCQPLPAEFGDFKTEIMNIFPIVYDTKFMAFEMKKRVGKAYLDTSFNLQRLYDYFMLFGGQQPFPDMPLAAMRQDSQLRPPNVHDSGYDSYCTGFVFLQLAHMFSLWDTRTKSMRLLSIGSNPACYFRVTENLRNRVNMMRGRIGHFNLNGQEISVEMQNLLLIESKIGEELEPHELMKTISRYDNADLRPLTKSQYLVASASEQKLIAIEAAFRKDGNYNLRWYNPKPKEEKIDYRMVTAYALMAFTINYMFHLSKNP